MQNLRYYIRREMIGQIPNERVEESYKNVNFEVKYRPCLSREMVIKDLTLAVSTHRLIFTCESYHSLIVDLSCILSVELKVGKQYEYRKREYSRRRSGLKSKPSSAITLLYR